MISLIPNPEFNAMFLSDTLSLTAAQMDRAIAVARRGSTEAQQWQQYLDALALLGVEQWLQKRAPELQIHSDWLLGPSSSQPVSPISRFRAAGFWLQLIATDDLGAIEIPLAQTEIQALTPHLYVIVEVIEELGEIQVRGAIQQSQLVERLRSSQPQAGQYWLQAEWFDASSEQLLLWLRCLDAAALPTVAQPSTALTQGAINLGLWVNARLDQLAQEFAWILLPPTANLGFRPLRSPAEELNRVLAELTQQRRIIAPPQTHGGYRDFQWENAALRLYAVTWKATDELDWTLLLILGAQPGSTLPTGTRLQVRDDTQVLAEPMLRDRAQEYLFTQVIGTGAERFWVSIDLGSGAVLTLPPFTFAEDANLT